VRINWYKLNRALHRDLGYFFFGMIFIYALSGIGLNHLDDWNPRYTVEKREQVWDGPELKESLDQRTILEILDRFGERDGYKKHYVSESGTVKVFIRNGTVTVNLETGKCTLEKINRRPLFFQVTFLHYNPKNLWTWFSDLFAASLLVIAGTGLFLLNGRRGLAGRGGILTGIGILVPLILLLIYL